MAIRRATALDVDAVVGTLVESHLDYAWEAWALEGRGRRARLTDLVRHHVELVALPSREVWIADDGVAVAIWHDEPLAPLEPALAERMGTVMRAVYGERLALIDAVDAMLVERRPSEPHRFLGSMGVLPSRHREGLGTAVLQPVLDSLDRSDTPACLETSSVGNVAFYESLGFSVLAHLDSLPGDAPDTWVMWRAPSGA